MFSLELMLDDELFNIFSFDSATKGQAVVKLPTVCRVWIVCRVYDTYQKIKWTLLSAYHYQKFMFAIAS